MALTDNEMRRVDFDLCYYFKKKNILFQNFFKKRKETFIITFHFATATKWIVLIHPILKVKANG